MVMMMMIYIVLFYQVAAVVYAILTTKSLDLSWQMRALRVLPMFAFPGISYVVYSTLGSYTKMRKDTDLETNLFFCYVFFVVLAYLHCKNISNS